MRRIVVCLLITLASTSVAAREVKLSDANGGSCPSHGTRPAAERLLDQEAAAPAAADRSSKATTPGGGNEAGPRLQAPRWHRFLPGMFR